MDKETQRELLLRQLGLKHKLKVHDSVRAPELHEEIAAHLLTRWEIEDEITAIELILADARKKSAEAKRQLIEKELNAGNSVLKKKK